MDALFSPDPAGPYHYRAGWNPKALCAFGLTALFSVATVWAPALAGLSGYGWMIGALLGGALYLALMRGASAARWRAA